MAKSPKGKPAPAAGVTAADLAREKAAQDLVAKHPEGLPREPDEVRPEAVPEPAVFENVGVPAETLGEGFKYETLGQAVQDLPIGPAGDLTDDERAVLAADDYAFTGDPRDWPELGQHAFQREVLCRMAAFQRGHSRMSGFLMQFVADSKKLVEISMAIANADAAAAEPAKPLPKIEMSPADFEGLAMAAEEKGQKAPSPEARRSWDELAKKCRLAIAALRG